jgi:hypothetical protein
MLVCERCSSAERGLQRRFEVGYTVQTMATQSDQPSSDIPAVQGALDQSPQHRHRRRKWRRFSRRKTKKVVRVTLIVAVHVILIAILIYIWTKVAYSSTRVWPKNSAAFACLLPANDNRSQS